MRTDILEELLKHCTSVKTVRLCLQLGCEMSLPRAYLRAAVVSLEDLYGGKLVAAMDRQHPRDIF